jgi:hypothetical protein
MITSIFPPGPGTVPSAKVVVRDWPLTVTVAFGQVVTQVGAKLAAPTAVSTTPVVA